MFEYYISEPGYTGGGIVSANDGGLLFFYDRLYKSNDEGQTLEPLDACNINHLTSVYRLQSGVLIAIVYDPKPQSVIEAKLNGSTLSVTFSGDEGKTWSQPQCICKEEGCYYVHNDRIIQLSGGRILIPANWVPPKDYGNKIETSDLSGCFYSDDDGKIWHESSWIGAKIKGDHLAESIAVELSDANVKSFMRCTTGYMQQSVSTDGGMTWEPPTSTCLRMPCSPFVVKKDPYTGFYYTVWDFTFPAPVYQYPRSPISLAVSRDGTQSWEFICDLENDPNSNYGYPALYFTKNYLITTYYVNNHGKEYNHTKNHVKLKAFERKELIPIRRL